MVCVLAFISVSVRALYCVIQKKMNKHMSRILDEGRGEKSMNDPDFQSKVQTHQFLSKAKKATVGHPTDVPVI